MSVTTEFKQMWFNSNTLSLTHIEKDPLNHATNKLRKFIYLNIKYTKAVHILQEKIRDQGFLSKLQCWSANIEKKNAIVDVLM